MLKLYEVFSAPNPDYEGGREKLACLDVTENSEAERAAILADLNALYGASCIYKEHDCGHDEGALCSSRVV